MGRSWAMGRTSPCPCRPKGRSRSRCGGSAAVFLALPIKESNVAISAGIEGVRYRTSPSIAPHGLEQDTYLVLDGLGGKARIFLARTETKAWDRETLIRDLVEGEYNHPIRIVAFNTSQGWCREVTVEIAEELLRRYFEFGEVSESVMEFIEANRR